MAARTPEEADNDLIKFILCEYLNVDRSAVDACDPMLALVAAGVEGFHADFVGLSESDIQSLYVPGTGTAADKPLPIATRRKLIQVLGFFHDASRSKGKPVQIDKLKKKVFLKYVGSVYDGNKPIRPWGVPVPLKEIAAVDQEVLAWQKNIKISASNYKPYKDEKRWVYFRKQFLAQLKADGLQHLINPKHKPGNKGLNDSQDAWLFKVLQDTLLTSKGKTIVTKYDGVEGACHKVWTALTEHGDKSMAGEIFCQQISTYLTSTRLHTSGWRGTQQEFLLHWNKQVQEYNDISPTPYGDEQAVTHLKACVAGTPNLATVYANHVAARKALGRSAPLDLEEYIQLLTDQAIIHDTGKTSSSRRSANVHIFDDCEDDGVIEAFTHDMDTPLDDLMVNQTMQGQSYVPQGNRSSSNSQRPFVPTGNVRMNLATWRSLSPEAQRAWDTIAQADKAKILGYVESKTLREQASNTRSVNAHFFDDDDDDGKENARTEVHTHRVERQPIEDDRSLLDMAAHKTVRKREVHNIERVQYDDDSDDDESAPPLHHREESSSDSEGGYESDESDDLLLGNYEAYATIYDDYSSGDEGELFNFDDYAKEKPSPDEKLDMKPPAGPTSPKPSSRAAARKSASPKRRSSGTKEGKGSTKKKVIDATTQNNPILIPRPTSDSKPSNMNRPYQKVERPNPSYRETLATEQYEALRQSGSLEEVSVQDSRTGKVSVGLAVPDTAYVDDVVSEANIRDLLSAFLDDHPDKITMTQLGQWTNSLLRPANDDHDETLSSLSHEAAESTDEQDEPPQESPPEVKPELSQGEEKMTMDEILAEAEEQEGDLTADIFLKAEREAIPELIRRGVLSDTEDERSIGDTVTSPRELTSLMRKANNTGTLSGVESTDETAERISPATSQRTTASAVTSGSKTTPSLYKPDKPKMPLPDDLQERLKIANSDTIAKQYGLSKNQMKSLRRNTKQLLALKQPETENTEAVTTVPDTEQVTTSSVAGEKEDDITDAPDSHVAPAAPPATSADSDGQSVQDTSQASSYHSEDLEDDTAGGPWLSPKNLKCWESKGEREAKKKAHQVAAKAAKKKSRAEKKKTSNSPHPKEIDQQRREERTVKHRKRTSDPKYDGLTTFQSPDKTGVKPDQSKDEESATSTPDSKKDFHKAKQN